MRGRTARFTAALQALLLMATLVLPALAAATEISTDLWIYQDGDTVTVTGIDFGANEVVDFVATDPNGVVVEDSAASATSPVSDEVGGVTYAFVLHVTVGGIYDLSAVGRDSGFAATTQFDPANNIPTTTTLSVSPGSIGLAGSTTLSGTLGWAAGLYNQGQKTKDGRTIHLTSYATVNCTGTATPITNATTAGGGASGTASYSYSYTPLAAGTQYIQATFDQLEFGSGGSKDTYQNSASLCVPLVVDGGPTVTTTTPSNGAINVALNANIVVNFSESVAAGSSISVLCTSSGAHPGVTTGSPGTAITFNPNTNFMTNESCTATVAAASVSDSDAIDPPDQMATDYVFTFNTVDAAPTFATTSPNDGQGNIALNANIIVNFTEAVTVSTSPSWIAVTCTVSGNHAGVTGGNGSLSPQFNPTVDFANGESCTVSVTGNRVSDVDANDPPDNAPDFSFTFTTIDIAPTVTSTSPVNGGTNVALGSNVVVNFSESVAAPSAISISCTVSGAHPGATTGSPGTAITFNPTSNFNNNETCTVTVSGAGVNDSDLIDPPNAMAADYVFSFETADAAPAVTTTSPTDGATNVAVGSSIVVNFSEAVTVDTSPQSWITVTCTLSGAHVGATTGGSSTFTFNPTIDFSGNETCTAIVKFQQVHDVDTNDPPDELDGNYQFSFTTAVGDTDGDGIPDASDNCPLVSNADQADLDGDDVGDACDPDDDGDGVNDDVDNCPSIANTDQADNDSDNVGDACDADDDNDGVADEDDNCQFVSNADQADNEDDGLGDLCDADDDNDGILDGDDNCQFVANPDQVDNDEDGFGLACDDNDYAPVVVDPGAADANGDEGDTLITGGAFSDGDGNDTLTLTVRSGDLGSMTPDGIGGWSWSLPTTDQASGETCIEAYDGEHAVVSDCFDWEAVNVAPTAEIGNDGPVDEGSAATVSLTNPSDPSSDDVAAGLHYAFSCSNADLSGTTWATASTTSSVQCTYPDETTATVSAVIIDKDEGMTPYSTVVTVLNANPVVATPAWASSVINCQTSASLTGLSFSDAGVNDDPWSMNIDWDGSSLTGETPTNVTNIATQGAQGNQSHVFTSPGTYNGTVRVTDEDGGYGDATIPTLTVVQTYTVNFQQPLDQSTSSSVIANVFKNGRVLPVKVSIKDDCTGQWVTGTSGQTVTIRVNDATFVISPTSTDTVETFSDAGLSSGNSTAFRWTADASQPGGGFWIYNLDSSGKGFGLKSGSTYQVRVVVNAICVTTKFVALSPTK